MKWNGYQSRTIYCYGCKNYVKFLHAESIAYEKTKETNKNFYSKYYCKDCREKENYENKN